MSLVAFHEVGLLSSKCSTSVNSVFGSFHRGGYDFSPCPIVGWLVCQKD